MSQIWVFSPSSEAKLRDCIAAVTPEANNKWLCQFKRENIQVDEKSKTNVSAITKPEENDENTDTIDVSETYEDFFDTIETDPLLKTDYIITECMKNNKLLSLIVERLSSSYLEKFCTNIINRKDINETFLGIFFEYFIPAFIKRDQTLFSLDLLVQAKSHTKFKKLLCNLLQDLEIPNKLLQDFVMTLNEQEKTDFIVNITQIDLSHQNFIYNIFTVYSAYKDCIKSDLIQNYILGKLKENGQYCATERHYGRLFLSFLQSEKYLQSNLDVSMIEELLELHRTPFKRPCLNVLNEIIEINNTS